MRVCWGGRGPGLRPAALLVLTLAAASAFSPACEKLDRAFSASHGLSGLRRGVSVRGRARRLAVAWAWRAPARAAAALLVAALRHAARYDRVHLRQWSIGNESSFYSLAYHLHKNCSELETSGANYDEILVAPGVSLGSRPYHLEFCQAPRKPRDKWVVGARLKVEGAGAGGAGGALGLHALLAAQARAPACQHARSWSFYRNTDHFERCAFTQADNSSSAAIVYTLIEHKAVTEELQRRIDAHALHLRVVPFGRDAEPRVALLRLLNERNSSFLFLDYDLWDNKEGVINVSSPPPLNDTSPDPLETLISLRAADDFILRKIAPVVLETLQRFMPSPSDLLEILELEAERPLLGIEEAACTWANQNMNKFEKYHVELKQQYWIAVFLCSNDPDKNEYKKGANASIAGYMDDDELSLRLHFVDIDCTNENDLNNHYFKTFWSPRWQWLIGVAAAGPGAAAAAETAAVVETALVLYDVPEPRARLGRRARAAAGSVRQLAAAIAHFFATQHWKRVAMLTENTPLGKGLYEAFRCPICINQLIIHNAPLDKVTPSFIVRTLKFFQKKEARIIFVNTNADIAQIILCKAYELGMTSSNNYAWILREWRAIKLKCNNVSVPIEHFTVSFWWRGGDDSRLTHIQRNKTDPSVRSRLNELWGDASWPPHAAPLADALQILIRNFKQYAKIYPDKLYDIHGYGSTELLLNSHNEQEIDGVVQQLKLFNGTIVDPLVFVDRWKSELHETLFLWRIQNPSIELLAQMQPNIYDGNAPNDGSRFCIIPTGEDFFPVCYDNILYAVLGFLLLLGIALYFARKVRLKRLARRDALLTAQLLAQREVVASALVNHYVDRAALELYHELGTGCYGRVRYGVLRAPDQSPVSVAVKESHDDASPADQGELLREACTIAALRHNHVVRLIGVCATGGPLLLLMEYAFFGDLHDYLCQRRHLAEKMTTTDFDETDEMYHVSAISLTRLGKEAAAALEYLAEESLVHRDVRASNCLIDARRTLKLGDFGLARSTAPGLSGEAAYACQRRGLLPVLWMAPESLERGVFSAASDAWALGVLLLELVTLGARPYGDMPKLCVIRYVCSGASPPLPPDTSLDTRSILTQCWSVAPEQRLSAAALVALLDARPDALRPALLAPPPTDSPTSAAANSRESGCTNAHECCDCSWTND